MNNKKKFKFEIEPIGIQNRVEKYIVNKLNLIPPYSYDKITPDELDRVCKDVVNNFNSKDLIGFTPEIILSLRANLMRSHMMIMHKTLKFKEKSIVKDYDKGLSVENLVIKYDGSPLNILRLIFQYKYDEKLTAIIKNKTEIKLNIRDEKELEWAKSHDIYALVNQDAVLARSSEFEDGVGNILSKHKIRFKTQTELVLEQIKSHGKPFNTPDFLLLDDLYIQNEKINWIDAKNFYGANIGFMKKNIRSQTEKYINEWGTGMIIYKLGFNSAVSFDDILLMDYESFKKI